MLAGIAAGADLRELPVFAGLWGVLLALSLRMGVVKTAIWVVTLSRFWRHPPDFYDPTKPGRS